MDPWEDLSSSDVDCESESLEAVDIDAMEVGPVREHGWVISHLAVEETKANPLVWTTIKKMLDRMVHLFVHGSILATMQSYGDKWSFDQLEATTAKWLMESSVSGRHSLFRPWVWSSPYLSDDNEFTESGRSVDLCFCLFRALYMRLCKHSGEGVDFGVGSSSFVDMEDCLEELGMTSVWKPKRRVCCSLPASRRIFVRDLNSVQLWSLCPLVNLTTSWIVADIVDHQGGKSYFEMEMKSILDRVTECLRAGENVRRGATLDCASLIFVDDLS